jgi:hypothetical protein
MLEYIRNLTYGEAFMVSMFTSVPSTIFLLTMRDYWRVSKIFRWEKAMGGYEIYNINFVYKYIYGNKTINHSTSTTKIYYVLKYLRKKFKRNNKNVTAFLSLMDENVEICLTAENLIDLINQGFKVETLRHKIVKQYNHNEIKLSSGLPKEWSDKLFTHIS